MTVPDMHQRTRILLGDEGLARLAGKHVLVAGVGGVGGAVAEAVARAGIGRITLLDHDEVSLSNLNRQLVALHSTLERKKAEAMAERLRDIRPDLVVSARVQFLRQEQAEGLIRKGDFDLVIDCIDSIACKAALIHACQHHHVPVYSSLGAGGRLDVSKVGVSSLNQTHTCPLARELRKALRERGAALNSPVVYSWETPIKALPHESPSVPAQRASGMDAQRDEGRGESVGDDVEGAPGAVVPGRPRAVNGTISYMPNLFGMMLAGAAITHLLDDRGRGEAAGVEPA